MSQLGLVFVNSILSLLFGIVCIILFFGYKRLTVCIGFVSLVISFFCIISMWCHFDGRFVGFHCSTNFPKFGGDETWLNIISNHIEQQIIPHTDHIIYKIASPNKEYVTNILGQFLQQLLPTRVNERIFEYFAMFEAYVTTLGGASRTLHEIVYPDPVMKKYATFPNVNDENCFAPDKMSSYFPRWYLSPDFFIIAFDNVSMLFIILTAFIMPIVLVGSIRFRGFYGVNLLTLLLLISQLVLILSFSFINFFCFFVVFESALLPLFLMIIIWGSKDRKIKSAFYFFVYTIITSVGFLYVILSLGYEVGTTNVMDLMYFKDNNISGELLPLKKYWLYPELNLEPSGINITNNLFIGSVPFNKQLIYWFLLFLTFANKLPMFPFYLWLPEAHVEAPTFGSVLLAAILLKLGSYGFFRFLLCALPQASYYFAPLVFSLATLSIIFCSLTAIRSFDLKKIIAYSSIVHMNFAILGLFSNTLYGIHGALLLFIGHGLVSSALFFLIGVLYDTYGTRLLYYFSGLSQLAPMFSTFFLFFSLSNIAFPCTINFSAELLILVSIFFISPFMYIFLFVTNILGVIYSIWTFTRLCFGRLKICFKYIRDLNRRELYSLLYLLQFVLFFGFFPSTLLNSVYISSLYAILR